VIPADVQTLKTLVREHWEREPCGIRYGRDTERESFFTKISAARYRLEPYIREFADFQGAIGKQVLEIGVGVGADFENWCAYADHATGIDLSERAIALTSERLALAAVDQDRYSLRTADAENLPFAAGKFDCVYSWGVLHHTPDTLRAFGETYRVLKHGGTLKAMIYRVPSWCGLMLYLQSLLGGNWRTSAKEAIFTGLESPGTKAYTINETRSMLKQVGYSDVVLSTTLTPGDLLTMYPSEKYDSLTFRLLWKLYPRWLVRLTGPKCGMGLLIQARKPLP